MVTWCFWLLSFVSNQFAAFRKEWDLELSTSSLELRIKLILLENCTQNSLAIFEHKSRAHKSWWTPSPAAAQFHCIPQGGLVGLCALGLAMACPSAPATSQHSASLWSPALCSRLQISYLCFSSLAWDGNMRTLFESAPYWGSQVFSSLLVKWKLLPPEIITSDTSSPLAHLPSKINMLFLKWYEEEEAKIN